MYIEYAKELIDKNIVRFEVVNGAWIGEIKKDNDAITLYCKDYGGNLVRTMKLKEDSKVDLFIEKIKYKFEEIDDMNQIITECSKKTEKEITDDLLNEYVDAKHKVNNIEERLFNKAIEVLKWESENLGKKSRYINGKWICDSVSIENAVVSFTVHIDTVNNEYDTYEFSIELHKLLNDSWKNIKENRNGD